MKLKVVLAMMLVLQGAGMVLQSSLLKASDSETVDGTFSSEGYNNPFDLEDAILEKVGSDSSTEVGGGDSLTPQRTYRLTLSSEDLDTFADLDRIEIRFLYNRNSSEEDFSLDVDATPDDGSALVAAWDRDTDASGFELVEDPDNEKPLSWSIESSSLPDSSDTSFDIVLEFKISEVAAQSTSTDWSFSAIVEDGREAGADADNTYHEFRKISMDATDPAEGDSTFDMDWYGAVDNPSSNDVSWDMNLSDTTLDNSASDFDLSSAQASMDQNPTYISNGPHEHFFDASDTWQSENDEFTATLNADDSELSAQEFALRVHRLDTPDTTNGAVQLDGQGNSSGVDVTNIRTREEGLSKNFNFYLRVAPDFQNATYTGTITTGIRAISDIAGQDIDRSKIDEKTAWHIAEEGAVPLNSAGDLQTIMDEDSDDFVTYAEDTMYEKMYDHKDNGQSTDYIMVDDIDLSSQQHTPIYDRENDEAYAATFDGNGYAVQNMSIEENVEKWSEFQGDTITHIGLFSELDGATVKNLTIEDSTFDLTKTGDDHDDHVHIGFLSGYTNNAEMHNIEIDASSQMNLDIEEDSYSHHNNVGGVVGRIQQTRDIYEDYETGRELLSDAPVTFDNVRNRADITADVASGVGGLVGYIGNEFGEYDSISSVIIDQSFNTGTIEQKTREPLGGLVGIGPVYMRESYNEGTLKADTSVAGLVFRLGNDDRYKQKVYMEDSYNTGDIYMTSDYSGTWDVYGEVAGLYYEAEFTKEHPGNAIINSYSASNYYTDAEHYDSDGGDELHVLGIGTEPDMTDYDSDNFQYDNAFYLDDNNVSHDNDTFSGFTDDQSDVTGIDAKTDSDMQSQSTFEDAGYDFDAIWAIDDDSTYPYLRWQD